MQTSHSARHRIAVGGLLLTLCGTSGYGAAPPPAATPQSVTPTAPGTPTTSPVPAASTADPLTSFAVFGADGVTLESTTKVDAGFIGSNGDVSLGPFSRFAGLKGNRLGYSSTGGDVTVVGPITFNGDVMLGQDAKVLGPVNSGGSLMIGDRAHISGTLTAAGNVIVALSAGIVGDIYAGSNFRIGGFSTINGAVLANGTADVAGTINGSVTCSDLSVETFGQVNGQTKHGTVPISPAKYIPEILPPGDTFQTGKADSNGATTPDSPLPPGHYAALNAPDNCPVYLASGDYYFQSVTLGDSASLNLVKISASRGLHVFVAGNVHLGRDVKTTVKGQPFANADPALAKKVFWEVLGKFDTVGSDEFFGTVFAPDDAITFGDFSKLTGSLISGTQVRAGVFFAQTFVPCGKFVALTPALPAQPVPAPARTDGTPNGGRKGDDSVPAILPTEPGK